MSILCKYLKRKEIATRLDISESEVLHLIGEGELELTPYIYLDDFMYGIQGVDIPFRVLGIVSAKGLFHPHLPGLTKFLCRDDPAEVHNVLLFLPSTECKPEISIIDEGWGDHSFDYASFQEPNFPFLSNAKRIPAKEDVASMNRFEVAQCITKKRMEGYPVRIGDFVYLITEVERIEEGMPFFQQGLELTAGTKKESNRLENNLSVFRAMENLIPEDVRLVFISDNYMEVSARGKTKQIHLSVMLLMDEKRKRLNKRGLLLRGMAQGTKSLNTEKNAKQISLIRTRIFQDILGITHDPFHSRKNNWKPRFTIDEELDRAGEREKERAIYMKTKGRTIEDPGDPDHNKDDDATKFIKKNSRKMK